MLYNINRATQEDLKSALKKSEVVFQPEYPKVIFQFVFKQLRIKMLLSNISRYSPTDFKIYLKKLEVVFLPEIREVVFQNFIVLIKKKCFLTLIGIVKLTSKLL